MTYNEKIIDISTGEETIREFTTSEIEELENKKNRAIEQAQAEAKARQAILDKLGLTADEVATLLG